MSYSGKKEGRLGEDVATKYLMNCGYKILERNFVQKTGEIDIIAIDKDSTVAFVEVKARKSMKYGRPMDAVNFAKQRKITRTALLYQAMNELYDTQFRFDVIEVYINDGCKVNHLENAFEVI